MQQYLDTHHLSFRRYRESDLDSIEHLLNTHYQASYSAKRKLIFDWVASHNPAGNEKCYLVLEDDDKIVAYEGRMPVDLMINGEKESGYFFHNTLVHAEYRKKATGVVMVSILKSAWEDATDTFAVAIWMNEFTHEILKRRGYYQLNAHAFVRPVNLNSVLTRVIKNRFMARVIAPFGRGLIGLYDFFVSGRRYPDMSISRIDRFDQRFDTLADEISKKLPLIVLRHSKYLNWKFVDKPFANYAIFTAERNKNLTGYVILLQRESGNIKLGIIVDILADPDDSSTITSLCQTAIKFFKKEKVDSIRCVLTNRSFIGIFKKYLFVEDREPIPVMIGNLHKHHARELITDINNWFLTFGDSDAVLWERYGAE